MLSTDIGSRIAALRATEGEEAARRTLLTKAAVAGDKHAAKEGAGLREAKRAREIEIEDLEAALVQARADEEAARLAAIYKRAQTYAENALAKHAEREGIAVQCDAAKRTLRSLALAWQNTSNEVDGLVQKVAGAMSEAGVSMDGQAMHTAVGKSFSSAAFSEFCRDARLAFLFGDALSELGDLGRPMINWQGADSNGLTNEAATIGLALKAALAQALPQGEAK